MNLANIASVGDNQAQYQYQCVLTGSINIRTTQQTGPLLVISSNSSTTTQYGGDVIVVGY